MSCPDVNCRKGGCTTDPAGRPGGGNSPKKA
jgi:hypothetical protein